MVIGTYANEACRMIDIYIELVSKYIINIKYTMTIIDIEV